MVIVHGILPSYYLKQIAQTIIQRIEGVQNVMNMVEDRETDLADHLARTVTDHATPVGIATVARTKRIPVEQRVEAAVIAWMRHQTTGYDGMVIPRVKGKRREVRRMLARRSQELLERYRRGESPCPLLKALTGG